MGLLQQPLERKLSAMLGAEVTFEKLHVSLLGGSVEAHGVTVISDDPTTPLLTIRKVRAEISIGAALRKEIVVKSLTVEKPVLTIVRKPSGNLNLPRRLPAAADAPAGGRQTSDKVTEKSASQDSEGSWKFEAQKVLVVDGEVHFRDADGFVASCQPVLAEVKQVGSAIEFTLLAESAGRRDRPAELGQIRLHGTAENVPTLTNWSKASVRANVELGEALRGKIDVPALAPLDVKAELAGAFSIALIRELLAPVPAIDALRRLGIAGRVELNTRATYSKTDGLRVPELTIRAADVVLPAPGA